MNESTEQAAPPPANPHADTAALDALGAEALGGDPAAVAAAPEPEIPTGQVLAMVLSPAFEVIAPNWHMTTTEVRTLADAYGAVLDKHFPDALANIGIELTAVVVTLAILAPRMHKPRKLEPVKPDAAKPDALA